MIAKELRGRCDSLSAPFARRTAEMKGRDLVRRAPGRTEYNLREALPYLPVGPVSYCLHGKARSYYLPTKMDARHEDWFPGLAAAVNGILVSANLARKLMHW